MRGDPLDDALDWLGCDESHQAVRDSMMKLGSGLGADGARGHRRLARGKGWRRFGTVERRIVPEQLDPEGRLAGFRTELRRAGTRRLRIRPRQAIVDWSIDDDGEISPVRMCRTGDGWLRSLLWAKPVSAAVALWAVPNWISGRGVGAIFTLALVASVVVNCTVYATVYRRPVPPGYLGVWKLVIAAKPAASALVLAFVIVAAFQPMTLAVDVLSRVAWMVAVGANWMTYAVLRAQAAADPRDRLAPGSIPSGRRPWLTPGQ